MLGLSLASALLWHPMVSTPLLDHPKSVTFAPARRELATDLKDPFRPGRRATRPPSDLKDPFGPGATPPHSFDPGTRAALRDPFAESSTREARCTTSQGVVIQRPNGLRPRSCKPATAPLRDPFEATPAQ